MKQKFKKHCYYYGLNSIFSEIPSNHYMIHMLYVLNCIQISSNL